MDALDFIQELVKNPAEVYGTSGMWKHCNTFQIRKYWRT